MSLDRLYEEALRLSVVQRDDLWMRTSHLTITQVLHLSEARSQEAPPFSLSGYHLTPRSGPAIPSFLQAC
jgi:hypothetical protein